MRRWPQNGLLVGPCWLRPTLVRRRNEYRGQSDRNVSGMWVGTNPGGQAFANHQRREVGTR